MIGITWAPSQSLTEIPPTGKGDHFKLFWWHRQTRMTSQSALITRIAVMTTPGPCFMKGYQLGLSLVSLTYHPTVSQRCLIPEAEWYLERTAPDMGYLCLCHITTSSSTESTILIIHYDTRGSPLIGKTRQFRQKIILFCCCDFLIIICKPHHEL